MNECVKKYVSKKYKCFQALFITLIDIICVFIKEEHFIEDALKNYGIATFFFLDNPGFHIIDVRNSSNMPKNVM